MSDSDDGFTREQFEAARLLIARFGAQSLGREFESKALGVRWIDVPDPVVAKLDDGTEIRNGDFLQAAMSLLWSALILLADVSEVEVDQVVAYLGVRLATLEPRSDGDVAP